MKKSALEPQQCHFYGCSAAMVKRTLRETQRGGCF